MLRLLTGCILAATLGVAGVLYKIKYDTRSLQREAMLLRRDIVNEQRQLAILKAEWSFQTRSAKIDQFASDLGLKPLEPQQILSFRDLDSLPLSKRKRVASARSISARVGTAPDTSDEMNEEMAELFSSVLFDPKQGDPNAR